MASDSRFSKGPGRATGVSVSTRRGIEMRVADRRSGQPTSYSGAERRIGERRDVEGQAFLWSWLNSAQR